MPKSRRSKKKPEKKLVLGDDAIENSEADWLDFRTPAVELAKHLYKISKTSGVCCGIIGPWGSGKSSFMRLMNEYIQKESSWKKVDVTWFTAWDPGGIQDLGDAMLYNFFRDVATKNQEMNGIFKELKKALGIRRSFRERASRVIEGVSGVIPSTAGRTVVTVAGKMLRELETAKTVQDCFEKLMGWLEKKNRTVFFFIDDIDRAAGEQIRDLLSELKVYISHRRIVAILAFDENYVLNALKTVLPQGTDPKRYLEKIVTIRRNLPMPQPINLRAYAEQLIHSMLDLPEGTRKELARMATNLSLSNPRRVKILLLTFTQFLLSMNYKTLQPRTLQSMLVTTAASMMGFLADDAIRNAIDSGREDRIISAIEEFAKKDSSKSEEAQLLTESIKYMMPRFIPETLAALRLSGKPTFLAREGTKHETPSRFDWRFSLGPLLSNAIRNGLTFDAKIVESSIKIVIPPSADTVALPASSLLKKSHLLELVFGEIESGGGFALGWSKGHMIVLLTSFMDNARNARALIGKIFDECAFYVTEKNFILWIIDDQGLLREPTLMAYISRAKMISKGLKHPFIVLYTPASKMAPLLEFLLSVKGAGSKT